MVNYSGRHYNQEYKIWAVALEPFTASGHQGGANNQTKHYLFQGCNEI